VILAIGSKLKQLSRVASDPRWWRFRLQRRVMEPDEREWRAHNIALKRRVSTGADAGRQPSGELAENGLHLLGSILSPEKCDEARNFLSNRRVMDPYRPRNSFLPLGEGRDSASHVGYHVAKDIVDCPHLVELANRPELLRIAEAFLGCQPTISYMAAWWSYPTPLAAQQAELFHRDVDDWRFLKLFVYLTDTSADNGAHVYVKRSPHSRELLEIRRFSDDEVAATFGKNAITALPGRAGEGFLENTFGLHRGLPLRSGVRLMFQAVYSLHPLPYGPRRPVAERPSGLDPYVNKVYFK